jgi:hypothetical protein
VTCSATSPTTGIIRVSVTTSGSPPDPDGYLVKLDGGDPGLSAGTSGSVSFTSVPVGSHAVALTGVAANCSVADGVSRTVTVTAGATADLSFVVTCVGTTGSIQVKTVSTGALLDADGYTVSIDGGAARAIGINSDLTVDNLASGGHNVALAELAGNCHAEEENPRTVEVVSASTATVRFSVTCVVVPAIAFTAFDSGPLASIVLVNPDGTGLTKLAEGYHPKWSPDGRKVLFSGIDGIHMINWDGTGDFRIYADESVEMYRWSPDGRMIAFVTTTCLDPNCESISRSLRVIRQDASGLSLLTDDAMWPAWSPDSRRIAYVGGRGDIYVINSDGTGRRLLTSQPNARELDWSSDGARLVFSAVGVDNFDIFVIKPDGSEISQLTQGPELDTQPKWSPDGSKLIYVTDHHPRRVAIMNRDGSGQRDLTSDPSWNDQDPDWSPDGRQIVFQRYPRTGGASDVYVMQADGTDQRNISNTSEIREFGPQWSPGFTP